MWPHSFIYLLAVFALLLAGGAACSGDVTNSGVKDFASEGPDWSKQASLPPAGHRANIYDLGADEWTRAKHAGANHALHYPVSVTGLLIPYKPFKGLLEGERGLLSRLLGSAAQSSMGFGSLDDVYEWIGLKPYPGVDGQFGIPFPHGVRPNYRMGVTYIYRGGAEGLTYGCATCHVGQLFGQAVFGMSARFPRANEIFFESKRVLPTVSPTLLRWVAGASSAEAAMLQETTHRLQWVGVKKPQALGLDTSLAQVGLSLARRELDPYATMTERSARDPRPNMLEHHVADSKPAAWWTLKYKTRWLSDGSVVSGNPVHTNFLWNELGRATDLRQLESWLDNNRRTVRDLTAAVFASEAPRYTDFFAAESISLENAKIGQRLFNEYCSRCHGTYSKGWDAPDAIERSPAALLETVHVNYHPRTFVVDVGTDPGRYQGMTGFANRLNHLKISQAISAVTLPQRGYVPPPLVGIWARWPYFHNNSVPSLCAVLTRVQDRPVFYYAGEPVDSSTDFDRHCNGYPSVEAAPQTWKTNPEQRFDTRVQGLSNRGHDEGVFLQNGRELMSAAEKMALIEFLKTL